MLVTAKSPIRKSLAELADKEFEDFHRYLKELPQKTQEERGWEYFAYCEAHSWLDDNFNDEKALPDKVVEAYLKKGHVLSDIAKLTREWDFDDYDERLGEAVLKAAG